METKYLLLYNLLSLHLLIFLSLSLESSSSSLSNGDSQALLSFKSLISDQNSLQNWQKTLNYCNFTGISCNNQNRVSSIDLSSTHLNIEFEAVVSHLFWLPNLELLSLKNCNLTGKLTFPARFSCSSALNWLDLSENKISGPVSGLSSFRSCRNLKSLNMSINMLDFNFDNNMHDLSQLGLDLEVLDLSSNMISGDNVVEWLISEKCGKLKMLNLRFNKAGGDLSVLEGCKSLEYLDLSANNFSMGFPSFGRCEYLEHLDLSSNRIFGEISQLLANCGRLSFLNLTHNQFSGKIPLLPSGALKYVYLSGNRFEGVLDEKIGDLCSTLVEFDVSDNDLYGVLPDWFGGCGLLEVLDVSSNNITGEIPMDVILKMGRLRSLVLAYNKFMGVLPDGFSRMTSLEYLDVSSNNISGGIPEGLCSDPRNGIKVLYLQNNMFGGPIPASLSNCSQLVSLDLSFNYLVGTIPASLGSLSKLKDLMMWLNQLHGEIPKELMYLESLENLILDFNDLTGSIPDSLSNCSNLNWISLSNNQFTGEIPSSFGQLLNLAILKLGKNSISGRIPAELGDCGSLLWLDLNTNLLNGTIPPTLFKQSGNIALSLLTGKRYVYIKNDGSKECHGAGNLLEFGGIRQEQLDRISTRHPCNFTRVYRGITQPTFNHNGSMIFLDLSYNTLEGSIPKELGSMYYLSILNLGHNDLAGPIPQELGSLKNVAILDLSYNSLNGSIPQSLTSLALLGEVDLSNNHLSGMIPQSAPFDTFPDYRFQNNSGLCGYPLPLCASGSSSNSNGQHQKSHRRQASLVGSVTLALLFFLFCMVGVVIILVETRKRKKKKEAVLDAYMDNGHSHSGTANSAWKLTSAREAQSINLAAFEKPLRRLTFADLLEATNGFHNDTLIGSGGFGDVYRAQLKDGSVVAIKKLIHVSGQGDKEFTAEMETIGKIKHRNLVPLLGYCKVGEERLLVYEFMKFGSLDDVLHARKKIGVKFDWPARRKVAIGAARGLAFLHHNCIPHIIHRDMKSSNVLIDENLEARVSDFGMARHVSAMDTHLSVSTLAGTPGYVPPEYYQSFRCSTKGDVYSFGVVLLELLTGRQPTDSVDFGDNNLVGWVKQHAKMKISDVFDTELLKQDPGLEIELLQHLKVACACLDDRPWKRPTMIQVMAMFKEIQAGSGLDSSSTIAADDGVFNGHEGVEMSIKEDHELGNKHC